MYQNKVFLAFVSIIRLRKLLTKLCLRHHVQTCDDITCATLQLNEKETMKPFTIVIYIIHRYTDIIRHSLKD